MLIVIESIFNAPLFWKTAGKKKDKGCFNLRKGTILLDIGSIVGVVDRYNCRNAIVSRKNASNKAANSINMLQTATTMVESGCNSLPTLRIIGKTACNRLPIQRKHRKK